MPLFNPEQLGIFIDRADPDKQVLCADLYWRPPPGSGGGTVTSVGLGAPSSEFTVSGSPVTTTGTLSFAWKNQSANIFFAGPSTGGPSTPGFRAIVPADLAGTPGAGKYWDGAGSGAWTTLPAPGTGTVTSVDVAVPAELLSSGGPITTSGTITLSWVSEAQHTVFAAPSGSAGTPSFRLLTSGDIPALSYVTSVGLSLPAEFTVSGSPVTSTGTLTAVWAVETANRVFAGPATGVPATPTFRALVAADFPAGTGTVTSVSLTAPTEITVGGSPITTTGTIALSWTNESANFVFAGPTSGGASTPAFRALVTADIPAVASTAFLINQTTHGFAVGDVLRFNGTIYVKALADSATDAEVVGIVSVVVDANNFYLLTEGRITGLSGLVAGTTYFLSPTSAGALTATEPTTDTQVTKPLLIADTTTSGYFFNWRGFVIGSPVQAIHTFYAGPSSGASAAPTFRAIVPSDLPGGGNATANPVFNYQNFI